jgi:regulator of ribonuclease activity A
MPNSIIKTADLCDNYPDKIQCADDLFKNYGLKTDFHGEIVTLKVFEDNTLVRTALEANGKGKALVIDGGGSLRCALVGGNLGKLAEENNWEGIVVFGAIRDVDEIENPKKIYSHLTLKPRPHRMNVINKLYDSKKNAY